MGLVTLYKIECSDPLCHAIIPESGYVTDKQSFHDCVDRYEWQSIGDDIFFCPSHIHARCRSCGVMEVGSDERLIDDGWLNPQDDALCIRCQRKEDERYR